MGKTKWVVIGSVGYILLSGYVLAQLYFGEARFLATVVVYSWAVALLVWCYRKFPHRKHWVFSAMTLWLLFFVAEVLLRYVGQKHMTYSEKANGRYVSNYNYDRMTNFQFLTIEGRTNAHTNEFRPTQKRNYSGDGQRWPDEFCNQLGTRGALPSSKQKVVYVLGDSFAEGVGTPSDSTFAVLLEQQYQKIDTSYSLLNLGVAGFDIFIDWNFLQKHYSLYRPQEIIVLLNTTDIGEVMTRGGKERFLTNGKVKYNNGPWWEPIYAVSFVGRLVAHSLLQLDWYLLTPAQSHQRKEAARQSIVAFVNNDIADWAEAHQVKVKIVLHPLQHEAVAPSEEYMQLAAELKATHWLAICNLQPSIQPIAQQTSLYWPQDQHFLPEGYAILAKLAADSCLSITHRN